MSEETPLVLMQSLVLGFFSYWWQIISILSVKPLWTDVNWKIINFRGNNEPDPYFESDSSLCNFGQTQPSVGIPSCPNIDRSGGLLVPWRFMTDVRDEVALFLHKALFLRQLHTERFTQQGNDWTIRWISTDFVSWNLCFLHLNSGSWLFLRAK